MGFKCREIVDFEVEGEKNVRDRDVELSSLKEKRVQVDGKGSRTC